MDKSSRIKLVQEQLAIEWNCDCDAFSQDKNVFIKSSDSFFDIITFGKNAVIKADLLIYEWCIKHFAEVPAHDIMDGENLFAIEAKLREFGKKLAGEHVRYIYLNSDKIVYKPLDYQYKLFDKDNIKSLYIEKGFDNALNYTNDVIALGAYHENKLIALAGADDGMSKLWQIGIDTLSEFRNKGLATYLVKTLADEIEKRGALPYYTTWSSNLASTKVALNTGFFPIWINYFSEDID